jgi:hypothetical protein
MPQSIATVGPNAETQPVRDKVLGTIANPNFIAVAGFVAIILIVIGLTLVLPIPSEPFDLSMPLP